MLPVRELMQFRVQDDGLSKQRLIFHTQVGSREPGGARKESSTPLARISIQLNAWKLPRFSRRVSMLPLQNCPGLARTRQGRL